MTFHLNAKNWVLSRYVLNARPRKNVMPIVIGNTTEPFICLCPDCVSKDEEMDKTQIWIIDSNNNKTLIGDAICHEIPTLKSANKSDFKENYNRFINALDHLEMQLEMFPEKEFWIGWDLCREAYIEQFQKQNRALLHGSYIGTIK